MAFKPSEVAEILVGGRVFRDWESVIVHLAEGEAANTARFTVSEGMPLAGEMAAVRIKPGEHCTIKLAGETAITGYVETRQVAYTATAHGVELIVRSLTKAAADASAMTKTLEFKKKNLQQIATELLKPIGIQFVPKGPISGKPFDRVNIAPGESIYNTIETLARQRGVTLGTDVMGNMTGRTMWFPIGDSLIEGINILEGRETWTIQQGDGGDQGNGVDFTSSQATADKNRWGAQAAHDPNSNASKITNAGQGGQGVYAPNRNLAEHPGDKNDAAQRANYEAQKRGDEQLQVQITVQGWLKPSGGLWMPGDKVHVKSPMLIVDEDLKLMVAEFRQDSRSGTTTQLELTRDGGQGEDAGKGLDFSQQSQSGATSGTNVPSDATGGGRIQSPA